MFALAALGAVALVALLTATVLLAFGGASDAADITKETPTTVLSGAATATSTSFPSVTPTPSPTPITHSGILDGLPMTDAEWAAPASCCHWR